MLNFNSLNLISNSKSFTDNKSYQRGAAYISLIKELPSKLTASSSSVKLSSDVPNIRKYLDFINVKDRLTRQNAPLYDSRIDVIAAKARAKAAINGWVNYGASLRNFFRNAGNQ